MPAALGQILILIFHSTVRPILQLRVSLWVKCSTSNDTMTQRSAFRAKKDLPSIIWTINFSFTVLVLPRVELAASHELALKIWLYYIKKFQVLKLFYLLLFLMFLSRKTFGTFFSGKLFHPTKSFFFKKLEFGKI